jgi:hypothetical protein
MSLVRVDGIHFGTGEDASSGFFDLAHPDSPTVINEPEAQWHYSDIDARRPNATNVWRSSPAVKPAQSGWSGHAFSREVFKGIDDHHNRGGIYPTDILLLNELNLDYERGDAKDDGGAFDTNPDNWPFIYQLTAGFLANLLVSCRERAADRGFSPRWWFPGWAPGHGEYRPEIASIWVPVATQYDAVCLHSYTDADTITSDVLWYLRTFPETDLLLGEWNTINNGRPHSPQRYVEEVRIRARLQALARAYSRLSATYFIYAWEQDRAHEHDIKGDEDRTAIWSGEVEIPYDPWEPTIAHPDPDPEEPPVPDPTERTPENFPLPVDDQGNEWQADTQTVLAAIREVAPSLDPANSQRATRLVKALGIAESGRDFQSQERWHIWTDHGKEAVRQRNWGYAAEVLGWGKNVGEIGTNDFSAGPFHQAWAWWDQFPGKPMDPNDPHRWDVDGWLNFRKLFIQDHGGSTRYAVERLRPYYTQRPDDLLWVLERYNKPNGQVSPGVSANYAAALILADTLYPEEGTAAPPPSGTVFERTQYQDTPAGTFVGYPRGVTLHGSRSGRASNPLPAEYAGTANWCVVNPDGLGWNATIGPGIVAVHLNARQWGWNARAASDEYLAVELAQPTAANAITDEQVEAFADWFVSDVHPTWPALPITRASFPTHAELEAWGATGNHDGKTDVFPVNDARADQLRDRIIDRINAKLGAAPTPPDPPKPPETGYTVGAGILQAMARYGSTPASDEVYSTYWSEAMDVDGRIYRYLPETGQVHVYLPE